MSPARAVLVVGVGLALLANPLYLPVDVGGSTVSYSHQVTRTLEGTVQGPFLAEYEPADVREFEDLSPEAKRAFRRALRAQNRVYVVTNESATAPEFDYPTESFSLGHGVYVIRYEGETYGFVTRRLGGGLDITRLLQTRVIQPVFTLSGAGMVLYVLRERYRERRGSAE